MTTYIILEIGLVLCGYLFLVMQFQAGSSKHTASITEVFESGKPLELLITQYWNILVALLCCIFLMINKSTIHNEFRHHYMWQPILICITALLVSMRLKLPPSAPKQAITTKESRYYVFIRSSYLVVYEWFFRGLLLQVSMEYFSVGTAVCINVFLYCIAHIYSARHELIACVPVGLLFCWLRLEYGSVLFPIMLHLCMAIPFELRMLRSSSLHHKNIKQ
ncbi:MAG TPA: CPBP family intramembrane glutamic endopeptidase [Flavitalea sp.]|nr:CPBP family intramembrane glutamic endopeptidase [Flavitalea sp.]